MLDKNWLKQKKNDGRTAQCLLVEIYIKMNYDQRDRRTYVIVSINRINKVCQSLLLFTTINEVNVNCKLRLNLERETL